MSNEEKLDNTKAEPATEEKKAEENVATAAEKTSEVKKDKVAEVKNIAASFTNIVTGLFKLQKDSPKLFYGGLGVVVVLILFMMMGGGGSTGQTSTVVNLVRGQSYTLKSTNSYDSKAVVRLVATPGSLAAYDDTEKGDRDGCSNVTQGTRVVVMDFYDAYGEQKAFSKVKIMDGVCKDTIRWTSSNNIK